MFQNKHYNKNKQIEKFASRKNGDNFIIEEDDDYHEHEYCDHEDVHAEMMSALPSLLNASLELTKLIIDNKIRNSEKMTDEDIYSIYRKSFQNMGNIFGDK
jgi:hypothetical protein